MLGVRTEAGTKCPCFFLSSFTGVSFCLSFFFFPPPDPSWWFSFSLFYSFFFLFISSIFFSSFFSFISSIFFIHLLHLLLMKVLLSIWAPLRQSFGRTSETSLKRCLAVYLMYCFFFFFFLLFWQSTFCIGLFKPLFVRCNTSLY